VLQPPKKDVNVIDYKWVYKVKRKLDGTVYRYNARLAAKGFKQRYGVEYEDTFNPVIKPTTICLVLSVVVSHGWNLRQLDIQYAFLHGVLEEEIYMRQPLRYENKDAPHHICRLGKAIFGLKQAPRAWYSRVSVKLQSLGFKSSKADSSLYFYLDKSCTIFVLVYAENIIIASSSMRYTNALIHKLNLEFTPKDLGDLHYFLGIEVKRTKDALLLMQERYVLDILERVNLSSCSKLCTPMVPGEKLLVTDGTSLGPKDAT
jgi:hypothetical protein